MQGWTNFLKNSKLQKGDMKQVHTDDPQILGAKAQNSVVMAIWHPRFVHLWVNTLGETYGTHSTSITTLWTAWRLLSIYPSSDRRQTDLKDRPENCIIAAACWNPGQKTLHHKDQMRLKRPSDDGTKLYYMKGIFYSIMFHSTQKGQITLDNKI